MSELEQVSKEMMNELDELVEYGFHNFLIALMYDDLFVYPALLKWLKTNENSNQAFENLAKHFNGTPQFEAEKWTNPQTEAVEVEA